jgi:aryl-alcohol dehydrogenase-like predicted oxidoreductase
MHYRQLGRTGWKVSDISFGAWAIGGAWGSVSDDESLAALHKAIDCGVNFIDTADVYGDGRSERLIAQLKKSEKREIVVATKAGRRLPRQTVEEDLRAVVQRARRAMKLQQIEAVGRKIPQTVFDPHGQILAAVSRRKNRRSAQGG